LEIILENSFFFVTIAMCNDFVIEHLLILSAHLNEQAAMLG